LTGLWQVADLERGGQTLDPAMAAEAMCSYVEAGFTSFDMADHYGSAEVIAGALRRRLGPATPVQLLTKWVPKPGPVTRAQVRAAVTRALDRLGSQSIDLLQFHAWSYADPSWLDCLFWLEELRAEGLIRHLGLTNVDTAHLRMVLASGIRVVSNQVSYSLLDSRAAHAMSALCQAHGIKLLAFGTLAGGLLSARWLGRPEPAAESLATWSQMKYRRFVEVAGGWSRFQGLLRTLDGVARDEGVSIANVACRYMLQQPAVGGIIIGARLGEREHIASNLGLFDFSLDQPACARIAEAVAALEPIPGDCGDEYRKAPFLTATGDLSQHLEHIPPPFPARTGSDGRTRVVSGTRWEHIAGFCRALRRGQQIWVSGTTATHGDRVIGGTDPAAQAHFVIDKIEGALRSLGATLDDVVRTRIYLPDLADWKAVARVHGERFSAIQPTNTLVEAALVGDGYRLEMEAEAVVEAASQASDVTAAAATGVSGG